MYVMYVFMYVMHACMYLYNALCNACMYVIHVCNVMSFNVMWCLLMQYMNVMYECKCM